MGERVAFCPKSGYEDPDGLGAIFVNDSTEVNLREEYAKGKGYIITEDPAVANRLESVSYLKRVPLKEAEEAAKPRTHAAAPKEVSK